ncbi:MAG: restriction endonuclease subunit S [Anaerolineae bacterium]|nr:restriction endonuclease subunit S [Anaerolineae bacterium]
MTEFRDTEFGALPADWEVETIANIIKRSSGSVQTGPFGSLLHASDYVPDGIPFIMPKDLSASGEIITDSVARIGKKDYERLARYHLQEGDLLVGRRGEMGRRGLVTSTESGWVCGSGCLRIRAGALIDPDFFSFAFETPIVREWLEANAIGTTMKNLSAEIVSRLPVILPPVPEQRAIARILSNIQRAIEKQDNLIAAARELKKSLMRKLFMHGLDANAAVKETEIGVMPEHWQLGRLDAVAKVERGKFDHRPRNSPEFYGGTVPFIQTGDVSRSNGRIRKYSQTLNDKGLSISRLFPKGTIALTIAANIGDCGILEFDSAFPDSLVGITPLDSMNVYFLNYYLRGQKKAMDKLAPRGTQKNINLQFLRPWPTPKPPLSEQREIARILATVDKKIENEEKRKAALEALFKTMLQQLMTAQIRVISTI